MIMPGLVCAEQWQILGTRPMGMGGAFVAMAKGPIAQYWNPAGLAQENNISGLDIPASIGIEMTGGIMDNASELADMAGKYTSIQSAQTNGTAVNAEQIAAFVKTLPLLEDMNKPGKGALLEIAGGINLKLSKLAVSVNNYTSIGLNPFVDTVNIGMGHSGSLHGVNFNSIDKTLSNESYSGPRDTIANAIEIIGFNKLETLICGSGGCTASNGTIDNATELANVLVNQAINNGLSVIEVTKAADMINQYANKAKPIIQNASDPNKAYTNNTSNLTVKGGTFNEIAVSYAKAGILHEGLSIGGNLKFIQGKIVYLQFKMLQKSRTSDAFSDALDNVKSSWKPALDIGFLFDVNKLFPKLPMKPRTGLVMRNINGPKFDSPDGASENYKLDGQIRWGIALNPSKVWNIACDMDITKNDTPVEGFASRQFALGTEFNIFNKPAFNLPLRVGITKNLAESDSKIVYTAGIGLNLVHFHIDIAGAMSSEKATLDDTEYPTKANAALSLAFLF